MAKFYLYEATVAGDGPFPADMLRYDDCWPAWQDDVSAAFVGRGQRIVRVMGIRPFTVARWRSFGWRVSEARRGDKLDLYQPTEASH